MGLPPRGQIMVNLKQVTRRHRPLAYPQCRETVIIHQGSTAFWASQTWPRPGHENTCGENTSLSKSRCEDAEVRGGHKHHGELRRRNQLWIDHSIQCSSVNGKRKA